jgi:hypothetical protein
VILGLKYPVNALRHGNSPLFVGFGDFGEGRGFFVEAFFANGVGNWIYELSGTGIITFLWF